MEAREFPGGSGGFSSWEVREGWRSERRFGSVERSERITFNIVNPLQPPGTSHNLSQTSLSSLTSHFESLPDLQVPPDHLAYLSVPP
ncbi:hypothetical protein [Methanocella sp. MCL-LM]|uniref:hypothetical protein n=1 Tax=Methanocella sp. MCL-LM TaxID=3412035 RepID=UPI003C72BC49